MSELTNPQGVATDLKERLQALQGFNVKLRHNLEAAEILIPQIAPAIDQLNTIEVAKGMLLSAGIIWQQSYEPGKGPADSAQIYLAALKVPGGIGALVLDLEEMLTIERENPSDPVWPATAFLPFNECPAYVKACLLFRAPELLRQLFRELPSGER